MMDCKPWERHMYPKSHQEAGRSSDSSIRGTPMRSLYSEVTWEQELFTISTLSLMGKNGQSYQVCKSTKTQIKPEAPRWLFWETTSGQGKNMRNLHFPPSWKLRLSQKSRKERMKNKEKTCTQVLLLTSSLSAQEAHEDECERPHARTLTIYWSWWNTCSGHLTSS